MVSVSCGQAVIDALAAHGVETVFGIPGTHTLALHEPLAQSPIRHVTPRHEQGGGYAADAYARVSGQPGVCLVTTGPGLTNLITAAATAHHDSVPMLIVTPGMPIFAEGRDIGFLHQVKDQSGAMESIVQWSRRVESASEAVEAIDDAFTHFAVERPRPVHVEIPVDVLERDTTDRNAAPGQTAARPKSDQAALAQAAELIADAREPWLLLGGGAVDAAEQARKLAEQTEAVVVTTVNGKGVVSESHPLSIGAALRLKQARDALAPADVVIAVGTEISESDLWTTDFAFEGKLIRVDIDPEQLSKNAKPTAVLHGDAASVMTALTERLSKLPPPDRDGRARAAALREALAQRIASDAAEYVELHRQLRDLLGEDAIVTGDSSKVSYYGTVHQFPVDHPRRFLYPVGYATLGYSLPAAIGAKLAPGERDVVAIDGDGGFQFTAQELATAAEQRLAIPLIVINNGGYGEIRDEMVARGATPIGVDLSPVDFPRLSEALGCAGARLEDVDQLAPAVEEALAADRPTLLELEVSR